LINQFKMGTYPEGAKKIKVDQRPGYPCRLSLQDAEVGETVILFTYPHHQVDSPYKSAGPVFVRMNGEAAKLPNNTLPKMLEHRFLSLRVYDEDAMMIGSTTVAGNSLSTTINELFSDANAKYIQVHNAGPGCYNCEIRRA